MFVKIAYYDEWNACCLNVNVDIIISQLVKCVATHVYVVRVCLAI